MHSRIIITLLFSIISYMGFAQEGFHRIYETSLGRNTDIQADTIFYHMNSATVNGSVTAMGTTRIEENNISLVFTQHDVKGNIKWDTEIDLGQDTVTILGNGEMSFSETNDSILFTIEAEINGESKQLYGKLSSAGTGLYLQTVGGNQFATLGSTPRVTKFFRESNLLVTQGDRPTISRLAGDREVLWSRTYEFATETGDNIHKDIRHITTTEDSTIIVLGNTQDDKGFLVAELDSNGVQIWAESYNLIDPSGDLEQLIPNEIIPIIDDNFERKFAIVGELKFGLPIPSSGFFAIVDTSGNVVISKSISGDIDPLTTFTSTLRNVIQAADNSLWMSGIHSENDSIRYFTTNYTVTGEQNWTTRYGDQTADFEEETTSIFNITREGESGAVLVGHGYKNNKQILRVMNHNATGFAGCSDTLSVSDLDIALALDTLITSVENGGLFLTDFMVEDESFGKFTPPTLTVDGNFIFCPNEIVDTVLVAMVSGVDSITYEWGSENGGTFPPNDSIDVFATGMYFVTVTIFEDVCYSMCDTVELTRSTAPSVTIGESDNSRCENGTVIMDVNLQAAIQDGKPGFTYIWSTGEDTEVINVTVQGQYSVTITDDCGDVAMESFTVEPPNLNSTLLIDYDCNNILMANYSSELGTVTSYAWSTGEDTQSITIPGNGDYSVTVTDNCGDNLDAEISINDDISGSISSSEQVVCIGNIYVTQITASGDGGIEPYDYIWSTGENTQAIDAESDIDYTVTITDACGISTQESFNMTFERTIPNPSIAANATEFCNNDTIKITANSNISGEFEYAWSNGDSGDEIIVNSGGEYSVTISDQCGTSAVASVEVGSREELCDQLFQFPKIFFPSGNQDSERVFGPILSDTIELEVEQITDIDFRVFNRWGEQVFESNGFFDTWDGTHKGDPAPSEVYIYYFTYTYRNDPPAIVKGDITLVR